MVSKTKAEDEKSSLILPSLPEDVIIDILVRLSRSDYPILSLVSKHFRSIVASPELYARRSLLACTENYLYVVLCDISTPSYFYRWCILFRKTNGTHCLVPAPSTFPYLYCPESSVAVGSRIYVFGGIDDKYMTTEAFCIDCGSHTVEPIPSMPVALVCKHAGFIDGKLYVIGIGCSCRKTVMVMFDIETQRWERAMIKPEMETDLGTSYACVVMADKIYLINRKKSYVYEPKESKWETDNMLSSMYLVNACVVDDVLYYHDRDMNTLRAYDPNQKFWGVVDGLKEFLAGTRGSGWWSYTVNYGGNMVLLFSRTSKIWCAEISLERRQIGEIWGKVKWCEHVFTGKSGISKSLAVMV